MPSAPLSKPILRRLFNVKLRRAYGIAKKKSAMTNLAPFARAISGVAFKVNIACPSIGRGRRAKCNPPKFTAFCSVFFHIIIHDDHQITRASALATIKPDLTPLAIWSSRDGASRVVLNL